MLFPIVEFVVVSLLLLGAYRLKNRYGTAAVITVVASIQFIQATLAAHFYWRFGTEFLYSPGSCILFAGNLALLLYAFERDDADTARKILYTIVGANVVCGILSVLFAWHISIVEPVNPESLPKHIFVNSFYPVAIGVVVLYLDQLLAIVLYAGIRQRFEKLHIAIPLTVTLVAILCFDTIMFGIPTFWSRPDFYDIIKSGMVSKSIGGLAYGVVWGIYLQIRKKSARNSISEVLDVLMFREDIESLRKAAVRDDLTGLYNRRSYNMILNKLVQRGQSGPAEKFAIILCDVDRFKQVNDRLGHSTGDQVLIDIADVIRSATREVDFAFRFGGDEFMLLLPNCGRKQASEVAKRLGNYEYKHPKLESPVTLSTGIAEYPADGSSSDELLQTADQQLYKQKPRGSSPRH